ncbi:tetraacyldisaccharide 4'-kinase [Thalassobaculum litoreum]|uniref:Tetraacyldisaccharide 4'-kinase n=1 Tax=Thalassobaculum litoreum DSM 18839 TaxID=1123362 RepID=A0A8G2BIG4_9PROT|nr:tetraacyldisaccharide 4'-kinase [Thalassobaculum litoreum]SDF78596.1 lipid-A-disaccharide kinase [Thalassobaculum litoreum DSM 18839]
MKAPAFWATGGWPALALTPASWLWRVGAGLRKATTTPYRPSVPLICVGNATAGGAGKTPTVLAVAGDLLARGRRVGLLSRGHGGRLTGPVRVDPARHAAADVGDEPLLLAGTAPTVIARDRAAGARLLEQIGVDVIVMDDGLQNPSLAPTLCLLVVDGGAGIGNGRLIPAGPLREPWRDALEKSDAVVLIGEDRTGIAARIGDGCPVLRAVLEPAPAALALRARRVLGFAGIGRPDKFRETLTGLGAEIVGFRAFDDHHPYRPLEVMELVERAVAENAIAVTTAKDAVRLPAEARAMVTVVDVSLAWRDPAAARAVLARAVV